MPAEEAVTPVALSITHARMAFDDTLIFSNLSLTLPFQEWTALLGPSGVGKSSLLRLIAGLKKSDETSKAHVETTNGAIVNDAIAYLGQTDLLLPWLNALDNATLSLKLRKHSASEEAQKQEKAKSLLTQVGLGEALYAYPHQLSGGMRQRVALVRTLIENKPIVLMDEPFSGLDALTRYQLQNLAVDLLQHKTVLFVTHDPTEALRLAHHIYLMEGKPAALQSIAKLSSRIPRDLKDSEVIEWQARLFDLLTKGRISS